MEELETTTEEDAFSLRSSGASLCEDSFRSSGSSFCNNKLVKKCDFKNNITVGSYEIVDYEVRVNISHVWLRIKQNQKLK